MKHLLVTLFLLISFLGFGQSVSAPDSKSFLPSTSGQNASGFLLSGFSSTDVVLASISLVEYPIGTTFYLSAFSGLTAASGFTLTGNKTRLVVTGSMNSVNQALIGLKVNTGASKGNIKLSVAATVNPTGYYYNGVNGHFYRPITNGNTYTGARAASLATTFKGQTGYLVTITSADEDNFIQQNVPQQNIWIALTDEVTEGQWVIDAGPEKGTLIKTSNGQTAGNIQGKYNNWAGGEPNNSGNEDYTVTKWSGGTQWNDLPNGFYCAFGANVDETKFSAKANTFVNNVWNVTTNTSRILSGLGKVDITNDLDTTKYPTGTKYVNLTPGEIEFCVIYEYDVTNKRYRVGLDSRLWQYTQNAPVWNNVTNLKLFDLYSGPVVPSSTGSGDVWWNEYYIYTDTQFNYANSSYQSNLRNGGGYYALKLASTFTFGDNTSLVQHGIDVIANSQTDLNTLYSSIVGVADVYLAFKELSNGGLFGNETGNEFAYGIQYMNADVNGDGLFNEADTYKLLQHLTGVESLTQYSALTYLMKLYSKSEYDGITKSNWNTQLNSTRSLYPFGLNTGTLNNTYNVSVSWVGDVNLSHSAIPVVNTTATNSVTSMSIKTMSLPISNEINASIITEIIGDSVYAYITIDPLQQELVGTQLHLNYDNSLLKFMNVSYKTTGSPTNYGTDKGDYVNFGSLITDGGVLNNTTEYKISFTTKTKLDNVLGLVSVAFMDAVNKAGTTLKVRMK